MLKDERKIIIFGWWDVFLIKWAQKSTFTRGRVYKKEKKMGK